MGSRAGIVKAAHYLLYAVSFASVFLFYPSPITLGDFWWHLDTGRWIVEHRALHADMGRRGEALEYYRRTLLLDPDNDRALRMMERLDRAEPDNSEP